MAKLVHIFLLLVLVLFIKKMCALETVPYPDELLGPDQCPIGSFCIHKEECRHEYLVTQSGMPLYCGPSTEINSKICCVSTEAEDLMPETLNRIVRDEQPVNLDVDTNPTSPVDDSDEVDITTLQGEEELNLEEIMDNPGQTFEEDNKDEALLSRHIMEQDLKHGDVSDPPAVLQDTINHNADADPIVATPDARAYEPQRSSGCPCEKGDPGPRGEPGEPGKIIYIPVFVNEAGVPLASIPNMGNGVAVNAHPELELPNTLNHLHQYAQTVQIPQHPNPIVVPYHVPISATTPLSSPPVAPSPLYYPMRQQRQSFVPQPEYSILRPAIVQPPTYPYTAPAQVRPQRHIINVQRSKRF